MTDLERLNYIEDQTRIKLAGLTVRGITALWAHVPNSFLLFDYAVRGEISEALKKIDVEEHRIWILSGEDSPESFFVVAEIKEKLQDLSLSEETFDELYSKLETLLTPQELTIHAENY